MFKVSQIVLKNNLTKITYIILLLLLFLYTLNFVTDKNEALANVENKQIVQVFKSPSCGCCNGYVLFLEKENFKVKQTDLESIHTIKQKYAIPLEMQSCHTTIIDKYFIEGHVPLEAINKLLKERPDIDGLALPGMPIGTPGMPGVKEEPYVIYQLVDGNFSVFMTI